jgi:hypothetical protein
MKKATNACAGWISSRERRSAREMDLTDLRQEAGELRAIIAKSYATAGLNQQKRSRAERNRRRRNDES